MLWNLGGECGFYLMCDGGKSWIKILGDDKWIGVIDIVIDFNNLSWIYVVIWDCYCMVVVYMGGGLGLGIYCFEDGGLIWMWLMNGLLKMWMGKIGIVIFL